MKLKIIIAILLLLFSIALAQQTTPNRIADSAVFLAVGAAAPPVGSIGPVYTNGGTATFNDTSGTQAQQWEVAFTGTAVSTTTITIKSCMRGGTCTTVGSTTNTANITISTYGLGDYYTAAVAWTGGDTTSKITMNRTATVSRYPSQNIIFAGAPTGTCVPTQTFTRTDTSAGGYCNAGTWTPWAIAAGAASWATLVAGTYGGGNLICGTGCSITTSGSGTNVATSSVGTSIAQTGNDISATFQVTSLHLGSQTANTFYAAPNGSSGSATFRLVAPGDLNLTTNYDILTVVGGLLTRIPLGPAGQVLGNNAGILGFMNQAAAPVPNVTSYAGTTVCDQINAACTANPFSVVSLENLAPGTYACLNVNITNADCRIRGNGGVTLTTSIGFNLDNRQQLDGWDTQSANATAPQNGFKLATDSNFPLGSAGGVLTTSGAGNTSGSTTLTIAKAAGSTIIIKPFDVLAISGDTTLYYVMNCSAGSDPPCANTIGGQGGNKFGSGYITPGGGTVTLNIIQASGIAGLAQTETAGTSVTLGHPLLELESASTRVGDSPNNIQFREGSLNCGASSGAQTYNINIGFRVNYAQENTQVFHVYTSNCPRGAQVISHSANSGEFAQLNFDWLSAGKCATGPDNGGAGTTLPVEISGAHKTFRRITITTQACTNVPHVFVVDDAQGGGVAAPGGIKFDDIHCEGQTANQDCVDLQGGNAGPVMIENLSGCPVGNPCKNAVHIESSFTGNMIMLGTTPNAGLTNYVQDDSKGPNTITVANNPAALTMYKNDSVNGVYTDSNCTDVTTGICDYNNIRQVKSGGTVLFGTDGTGNIIQSGVAFASLGTPAVGTTQFCTNCVPTTPATCPGTAASCVCTSGTGSMWAKRENFQNAGLNWYCH